MAHTPDGGGGGGSQIPFLEAMGVPIRKKIEALAREKGLNPADTEKTVETAWALAAKAAYSPMDVLIHPGEYLKVWDGLAAEAGLPKLDDFKGSIVNTIGGLLSAAFMFGADNLAAGFTAVSATIPVAVSALGNGLKVVMAKMGMADLAENLDTGGDPLAFFGSIQDIVIDERRLTHGPLSIGELLRYENRLAGLRMGIVLISFIFSIVVEIASLGQVEGFVGLLLHMIDEVVADASRVVSTQLVRKAVADPFTDFYTSIHRTKDASPSELAEAYKEGLIGDPEIVAGLAKNGYTDDAITVKVGLARSARLYNVGLQPSREKPASSSVIEDAVASGWVTPEVGIRELSLQGLNDTALAIYWNRFTRAIYSKKNKAGAGPGPSPGPGEGAFP